MKRLGVIFLLLFGTFLGSWYYKIMTPIERPDEYAEGYDENAGTWWKRGKTEVDDSWRLDPEIPLNYIPVPGEYELYMVIDTDGKIIGYRKRTKQIDGSWLWTDVNPDIPEDYIPVDGLKDVYKVISEDGTVRYYKYIRNEDDTFAFVEVDENGNPLKKERDATTIDTRHVHITGNIYSELNDYGVVIGYDKRMDNGDGTFSWIPTELPDYGNLSEIASQFTLPEVDMNSGYDELNSINSMIENMNQEPDNLPYMDVNSYPVPVISGYGGEQQIFGVADVTPKEPTILNHSDGTHTEIEVIRESKSIDGWTTTYETTVKKTYDADGNLISTMSDGPYEVENTRNLTEEPVLPQSNTSGKQETLQGEVMRVTGSFTYMEELGAQVYGLLNAQRASNGLPNLQKTEEAMQIAKLRAADMAGYDTTSAKLPTYGTLNEMLGTYGLSSTYAGENLWKTTKRTANEIHTRLQALDDARKTRMDENASQYGIAIVASAGGYYYIIEVVL